MSEYQALLTKIPSTTEIIKVIDERLTRMVLQAIVEEFEDGHFVSGQPLAKMRDHVADVQWWVDLPYPVHRSAQARIREELNSHNFSSLHFSEHDQFVEGFTRLTIRVDKE